MRKLLIFLDTGLPDISLHVVNAWKMGITGDQKYSLIIFIF